MPRTTTTATAFPLPSARVLLWTLAASLSMGSVMANQTVPKTTTSATRECFAPDGNNLREAVQIYLESTTTTTSAQQLERIEEIQALYGSDISDWCVDQVTDFSLVFANQGSFNVDISGWNVTRGESFAFMFQGATSFDQNLCSWGAEMISNNNNNSSRFRTPNTEGMFTESGCPEEVTPLFMSSSSSSNPNETLAIFTTSFCQPCHMDEIMETMLVKKAVEQEVSSATLSSAQSRPTSLTSNGNLISNNQTETQHEELLMATIAQVHSHDAAASGAHYVFMLMILVFAINGMLLAILQSPSRSWRPRQRRPESYTQLSLMSHAEEKEDDDDNTTTTSLQTSTVDDGCAEEMELAEISSTREPC